MSNRAKSWTSFFGASRRASAWAVTLLCALTMGLTQAAQAQTYSVVYNFSAPGGFYPIAGVTVDRSGNLYGTTF